MNKVGKLNKCIGLFAACTMGLGLISTARASLDVEVLDATVVQNSTDNTITVRLANYTDAVDLASVGLEISYDPSVFTINTDPDNSILSYTELNDSIDANAQISPHVVAVPGTATIVIANLGTVIPAGDAEGDLFSFDVDVSQADPGVYNFDIVENKSTVENLNGIVSTSFVDGSVTVLGVSPVVTDATVDLPEDAADGADVHAVEATDAQNDIKETGGYAITAGDADGAFAIDDAGQITVADSAQLDFETTATYNLTVEVTDDEGNAGEGTVTVNLTDVNEAPTAVADSANATEDGAPVDIDVLANDTDPDAGDTKKVVSVDTDETVGTVVIDGDGTDNQVNYDVGTAFQDLAAGETATDTFDYTMEDSGGLQDSATVTVTITGVNDAPTAQDAGAADDRILVINGQADNAIDLANYANDVDSDDSPADLAYAIVDDAALPAGITASITDEILTFDASAHTAEVDFEITFNATDSHDDTSATRTIYLSAINNQPPVITEAMPAQDPTIDEGDSQEFAITASDAGNQPQDDGIASIVWYLNTNDQGFVQVQDSGLSSDTGAVSDSYTFNTDQDTQLHDGSNTFVVRVEAMDGEGVTNRQEWTVTVNDVNNPPSIDTVTVLALDATDTEVSPSKPGDVTKLVGTASISDLDAEDFENGLPVDDDEVVFTWILTRKGVNNDESFQVASTTITAAAVPNPFEVVLDEAALNAELANQGADQDGFQKDDQFVLLVTANDGAVDTPVPAEEGITLGNPGWFPAISWTDVPDVDDYKVEVFAGDMAGAASRAGHEEAAIVTMYTTDPQVKVADYFAGQWDPEYRAGRPVGVDRVFGLRPGQYTYSVYAFDEDAQSFPEDPDVVVGELLTVDAYDAPAAVAVGDPMNGAAADGFFSFNFELQSVAGYKLKVTANGETVKHISGERLFRPLEGTLSTDYTPLTIGLNLDVAGDYIVELMPFNPNQAADVVEHQLTVTPADLPDPQAPVVAPQKPTKWNMTPGYPTKAEAQDSPEAVLGENEESAILDFSWNPAPGATSYRVVAYNAAGDLVPGLNNIKVDVPYLNNVVIDAEFTGVYRWYVKAENEGQATDWSPERWFVVEPAAAEEDYDDIGTPPAPIGHEFSWDVPAAGVQVYIYNIVTSNVLPLGTGAAVVPGDGTLDIDVTGAGGDIGLGLAAGYDLLVGLSTDGEFWQYWRVQDDGNAPTSVDL